MATSWVAEREDPRLNAVRYAWLGEAGPRERQHPLALGDGAERSMTQSPAQDRRDLDGVDAHEGIQCADHRLQLLRQVP